MHCTGAMQLVKTLIEEGVDTVFGYPGGAVLDIYDELYKNRGKIRHILTSHEQHASHAADGYARSTGKTGVCLATSGPGATNLVTGIATAYMDSSPIVVITGNVATNLLGRDSFQEVDIVGITMPIVKHSWLVKDAAELPSIVKEAFLLARSGRPGPVLIDIPKDVAGKTVPFTEEKSCVERIERLNKKNERQTFTREDIEKAADMIHTSPRPLIYAGGGVVRADAAKELAAFAEKLGIPVVESLMAQGTFPRQHPLYLGLVGMHGSVASNKAVQKAELIIVCGARFSDRVVSRAELFAKNARILQFDIDAAEINKNIKTDFHVIGGIKEILPLITEISKKRDTEWGSDIAKWKSEGSTAKKSDAKSPPSPRFVIEETGRALKAAFGEQPFVVTDVGQHQMWTAQFYPFEVPRSFLTSGGLGTMGFGLGCAVGCAAGNPGKHVVLFTGDGSFRMNCAEMATLVNNGFSVLIVLLNNRVLGMVRQWQTLFYEKRFSETILGGPPDFVKLAESYSVSGFRAETEEEFLPRLQSAIDVLKSGKSALLVCDIGSDEFVLPMVPSGKPLDEQIV